MTEAKEQEPEVGSRAAFGLAPPLHLHPRQSQHMAACASPARCLQQEGTCCFFGAHGRGSPALLLARSNGCVMPLSRLLQWVYSSIANPDELKCLRNHVPNTGVPTPMRCALTLVSAVIYLPTSKETQKWEWGRRVPPVPGHFRRQLGPSLSHSWLKHCSHMMQITESPQRTTPQAETLQVLYGKVILLWHALDQTRFWRHSHLPHCLFLPHQMSCPSLAAHVPPRLLCDPDQQQTLI